MRQFRSVVVALVFGLFGCASAQARQPAAEPATADIVAREKAAKEAFAATPFVTYDQNADRALDRDEWRAREWAYHLIRDRDGDGRLNFTEFMALKCGEPVPSGPSDFYFNCARVVAPEFRRATGSYDGAYGSEDARRQADRYFRANDKDNDGLITEAELKRR